MMDSSPDDIEYLKLNNTNESDNTEHKILFSTNTVEIRNDDQIPLNNNLSNRTSWNRSIVELLKKIGERSLGYRWMHNYESDYFASIESKMATLEMLLIGLIGVLETVTFIGAISGVEIVSNLSVILSILGVQILLTFLFGIVKTIRENSNYPKQSFDHKYCSNKFNNINLKIQEQFSLEIERRDDDKTFTHHLLNNYNELLFESPSVRNKTMKKYMNGTKDSKINKPITIAEINGMDIMLNDEYAINNINHNQTSIFNTDNTNNGDEKFNYELNRWLQNF